MARIGVIQAELYNSTVADECPVCQRLCEIKLTIHQGTFILAIPFFPTGRSATIKCCTCGNEIGLDRAPKFTAQRYHQQINALKTPVWTYSGLLLMAGLSIFALISIPANQKKCTGYINNPHLGDVYEIRYEDHSSLIDKNRYTLLKVIDTSASEITFVKAMYESNSKGISKMKNKPDDELWSDDEVTYTKKQLIEQLGISSEPHLSGIDRKE